MRISDWSSDVCSSDLARGESGDRGRLPVDHPDVPGQVPPVLVRESGLELEHPVAAPGEQVVRVDRVEQRAQQLVAVELVAAGVAVLTVEGVLLIALSAQLLHPL